MARPTLAEEFKYHTAGDIQRQLGISPDELRSRLKQKILPAPTYVNGHGLRFFDDDWLREAKAIIDLQRQRSQ